MSSPGFTIDADAGCLHMLMNSSIDTGQACLKHAVAGDSILLLDTAVTLLLVQSWTQELPAGISVFAAEADVLARGMSGVAMPGQMIDDRGWAELVRHYSSCLSWT